MNDHDGPLSNRFVIKKSICLLLQNGKALLQRVVRVKAYVELDEINPVAIQHSALHENVIHVESPRAL